MVNDLTAKARMNPPSLPPSLTSSPPPRLPPSLAFSRCPSYRQGRDEFIMLAEQPRAGLSEGPERYLAKGVRAPTKVPGFFLAGEDLTISGMEGSVMGG